ncbi:Cys-Gln thioester bond-forming surface protein [Fructobacillus sp. M2-14]|uniref:Cys-Gln thioester bond-forming surface protein n=1 Tax=Fructobacillus broussonetiae TaxID=2713173 RepID=A0ABS5R0M6_9LACO|nr:Cys-Gln thioester bond-forming surface protein [Fructobacillus broussonetiae]MBS9338176.1 Cys-Gln thioester bond-forming surface protein [Fructobacillus broussonetiae]
MTNQVSADTGQSGTVKMNGKDGTVNFSSGGSEAVINLSLNGESVYCINPFVIVHDGALASASGKSQATQAIWSQTTDYKRALANNVAYVESAAGAGSDSTTYTATQLAMWSVLAGQNGVDGLYPGSNNIDISKMHNVLGWKTLTSALPIIQANVDAGHRITIVLRALSISRSTFYNWLHHVPSKREQENQWIQARAKEIWLSSESCLWLSTNKNRPTPTKN